MSSTQVDRSTTPREGDTQESAGPTEAGPSENGASENGASENGASENGAQLNGRHDPGPAQAVAPDREPTPGPRAEREPPDEPELEQDPARVVRAAGVLVWRTGQDGVPEVLLVHRPRDDDWSWPKGKVQPGETLPECAVRETLEETGVTAVLGQPLPGTRYRLPDGQPKQVAYWAGRQHGAGARSAPATEVDDLVWLPVPQARERLTRVGDHGPLEALAALAEQGQLNTVPAVVVRHATARPRDAWPRADADRPLVASGKRQALALASLLRCWRPEQVVSSPWRRCIETIGPYVAATGARLKTKGGLSEDGHRRSRSKARKHAEELISRDRPGLLCTHRPVLGDVLDAVQGFAPKSLRGCFPTGDPWLAPGEAFVCHVVHAGGRARIVAVERHVAPR